MLTDQDICLYVSTSFRPNRCVAEIWDYGKKLRFRVFDSQDKPLATMADIVLNSVRELEDLHSLCEAVRLRIGPA